ncbi:hypothetical protein RBB84_03555 [Rhodococcus sp. D-6]|uniref:Uncharacterized protein n=1 Tax=Rhodococcus sp. D-6 TaxID=1387842 RepID=A0AAU7UZ37_9NOCA
MAAVGRSRGRRTLSGRRIDAGGADRRQADTDSQAYTATASEHFLFFYAHGEGGSPEWSGPFVTNLPQQAFDWCWNTASSSGTNRGLQKLIVPTTSLDHTVVFS